MQAVRHHPRLLRDCCEKPLFNASPSETAHPCFGFDKGKSLPLHALQPQTEIVIGTGYAAPSVVRFRGTFSGDIHITSAQNLRLMGSFYSIIANNPMLWLRPGTMMERGVCIFDLYGRWPCAAPLGCQRKIERTYITLLVQDRIATHLPKIPFTRHRLMICAKELSMLAQNSVLCPSDRENT